LEATGRPGRKDNMKPLTTTELAERVGCTTRHVADAIIRGELPAWRIDARGYRVAPADAEVWLAATRVTPRHDVVGEAIAQPLIPMEALQ
jgi:excisionase family DNA binding protein